MPFQMEFVASEHLLETDLQLVSFDIGAGVYKKNNGREKKNGKEKKAYGATKKRKGKTKKKETKGPNQLHTT